MHKHITKDSERTGKLTVGRFADIRYNGKLDIPSSEALRTELFYAALL